MLTSEAFKLPGAGGAGTGDVAIDSETELACLGAVPLAVPSH